MVTRYRNILNKGTLKPVERDLDFSTGFKITDNFLFNKLKIEVDITPFDQTYTGAAALGQSLINISNSGFCLIVTKGVITYDIYVDGVLVVNLTPNEITAFSWTTGIEIKAHSAGNASASMTGMMLA